MNEIVISSIDAARIQSYIEQARNGGGKVGENLVPLMNELSRAKKVAPENMPPDVVTMNSIVSLLNVKNNKVVQFQIVYPPQSDIAKQKISIFAPVGTALLGYRKGDQVEWDTPAGKTQFKILDIIFQPEADGKFDL
ncbi:MAG TPA: nucleoside diphosphate kinase regulator [Lentimicrobium sp.]|nr:nucleoside diphosphate kinase regulator [Lentimicrobium sp.]